MSKIELPKIPPTWHYTKFTEIGQLIRGVSYKKEESSKEPREGFYPILRANNIQDDKVILEDFVYVPEDKIKDEQFLKIYDIIIAMSSGSKHLVGKSAQILKDFYGGFGTFCGLLRMNKNLNQKFIGYFFQSPYYREKMSKISKGVNINNLKRDYIENLLLPIPPRSIQDLIVIKIEELFTKLDYGLNLLNVLKARLKQHHQSILKYAFEGKLTEEWRKQKIQELEPASKLLEIIKLTTNYYLKNKKLPEIDISSLPKLPEKWIRTRIGELFDIVGGGTPSTKVREYWEGDIPWITSGDLYGIYDIKPRRKINQIAIQNSSTNFIPEGNIIVATRVGLGKISYNKFSLCINQDLQALITNNDYLNPNYSIYYLSQAVQTFKYKHRGTTVNGVTKKQLSELPFVLPPIQEQFEILERIQRFYSIINNTEKIVNDNLAKANLLKHSILKYAFEGNFKKDIDANKKTKQIKLDDYV